MSSNAVEIRLCDEDRQRYGGDEWLTFDTTIYDKMETEQLEALETAMHMSFFALKRVEIPQRSARSMKAMAWLARQAAGLAEPSYDDFRIHPLAALGRAKGDDEDVPLDSSSTEGGGTGQTPSATSSPKASPKVSGTSRRR